jgi:hypothetical protein
MKKFPPLVWLLVIVCLALIAPPQSQAQIVRDGATNLILYNAFTSPVTVMVQVPNLPCAAPCVQSDGCPTGTVANIRYYDITANGRLTPLTQFAGAFKGWFILPVGHKVQLINVGLNPVTGLVSSCFQGMTIGFGQVGNSCPDFGAVANTGFPVTTPGPTFNASVPILLPNGSNSFEPTLNLPGTVNGAKTVFDPANPTIPKNVPTTEGLDISCVNGANSALEVTLTPPANGPYWQANLGPALGGQKTFTGPTKLANSWVNVAAKKDDNCSDPATGYARPGVYPYGCTVCNAPPPDPGPSPCGGPGVGQFCAAKNGLPIKNGCLFTRTQLVVTPSNGIQKFGGTVLVTYKGPLSP